MYFLTKIIFLMFLVQKLKLIFATTLAPTKNPITLPHIDPRIIGGSAITINQAPWIVNVRLAENDRKKFGDGFRCGGSVITPRVVITAAHCIAKTNGLPTFYRNASEFTLVMGSVQLYEKQNNTLQYSVLKVIVHDAFNITTFVNDVALMFIDGKIPNNYPTVTPILLNRSPIAVGTLCTISGWGKMKNGSISTVLMGATVPIVSSATCSTNLGTIDIGMICAGNMQNGGVDACQGDSGGPLECNGLLAGIVSWGVGCALPGYPGVYTNVSDYYHWITTANSTFNYTYDSTSGADSLFASKHNLLVIPLIIFIYFLLKF